MKKSLFVAGLDFGINDENLKEVFSSYGTVESAKVITDRFSGKSRGFGFVEMATPEEAQECIKNLDNTAVKGRQIAVRFKEERSSGRA
ncbi:MAG: RNA recognition motif domain-containing protein [Neisseriaceae bacterium]